MKKIYKIAAILVAVSLLVGCDFGAQNTDEDNYAYVNYWVSFENKTQHSMNITLAFGVNSILDPSWSTYDYVIEAGEHLRASPGTIRDESGAELAEKLHRLIIPYSVYIVYDNKYSISFERNSNNDNLCKLDDYQMLRIHEYAMACHYDFAEEDYEYAKIYGKEVGVEE